MHACAFSHLEADSNFKMNRTSAEPARTTAYSPDIGWRVVWQKLGMDLTYRQIAHGLQIAVGTAHRIFKRFTDTGDVSPTSQKGVSRYNLRKLDQYHELYILCLISEKPGLYLAELCQNIHESTNVMVSGSTICRLLHRNGCSRKKIVQVVKQRCLSTEVLSWLMFFSIDGICSYLSTKLALIIVIVLANSDILSEEKLQCTIDG